MARDCEDKLNKVDAGHYAKAEAEEKSRIRHWAGCNATCTTDSFCLAKEWFSECKRVGHIAYMNLPDGDDIGRLRARDWETIRDLPALARIWAKVKQTPALTKEVRRIARPGPAVRCADWNAEGNLRSFRITRAELEKSEEVVADAGAELGLLVYDQDGKYELFPLFKAYVFYSSLWSSKWVQLRWIPEKLSVPVKSLQRGITTTWNAAKKSPQVLTVVAFACLFLAFLALAFDHPLWLPPTMLLYILLLGPVLDFLVHGRRQPLSVVISVAVLLLTLSSAWLAFAPPFLPQWPGAADSNATWAFSIAAMALFLVMLSIVWLKSIHQSFGILLAVIFNAGILLQRVLGMEVDFIARSTAVMLLSLTALYLLHRAGSILKDSKLDASPLGVFLTDVASAGRWKKPLENWHWPNGLLFALLFVLALWLFFSLFRVNQETCLGPDSTTVEIVYPSWLSDRDQGSVYLTLTAPTTPTQQVYLEPVAGNLTFLNLDKAVSPGPSLALTPTVTTTATTTATKYSRWQIQTLSPVLQRGVTHWQFRASLVDGLGVHDLQPKHPTSQDCVVSIPRVKLPFGLRGFLEVQPFVTLVGILYGLAQTILQLWVGEKAFAEGKGTPNERQVKG